MDTTTSLAYIPVFEDAVVAGINDIRSQHDKAHRRWMPHVNFIFPYVSLDRFDDHAQRLAETVSKISLSNDICLKFDGIGFFRQKTGYTFHLKPDYDSERYLSKIYNDVILSTLSSEVQVRKGPFHPHLTLAQCSIKDFDTMKARLDSWFASLTSAECDSESASSPRFVSTQPLNSIVMLRRSPDTCDVMTAVKVVSW